jgi:hypothetical protein
VKSLLTQCGRARLGNMVDPKYTLGASILKILSEVKCRCRAAAWSMDVPVGLMSSGWHLPAKLT